MSISILDLSNNKLSGAIPDCLISRGKIPNLTVLDLHTNKFHGNIPDSFVVGNKLQILNLNNNDFDWPLPKSLENCHDLQVLNLGNNKINDTFPHWLGTLPRLEVLVLRSNYFHGQIRPSENESHFPALGILDLSHNEFSGNNLQILNLNNNDFDGPFPKSLENCRDLQVLNLGNNKINDTFPHWLGTLPQLQVLVLRSNYFHGQIRPSENESHFSALRILDLSNNEFSGFLPTTYFKSFEGMMNLSNVQTKSMEDFNLYYNFSVRVRVKNLDVELKRILTLFTTIDMSSNKFLGKIPEIVGDLISLQVLNFSHNSLTGHIPSSLGNLAALESLDLSSNKLVGEIPMQLIGLIFLEVLNLSQNQLVGHIPQGNQFNTFLNDYYGGNLGLCGFPVSKRCGKDEEQEPPESVFHEEGIFPCPLNWKFVMMGYGCGLVLGLSAGYIMLTIRKPEWLVRMGLDSLAVFSLFVLTVLIPEGTVTCELVTCLCTLMNEITRLSKERTCKRVTEVIRFQFKVEFFQQVIQRKNLIQHNLKNSLDDGMSSYGLVLVVHGHLFRALTTLLFIYNNLIGPIDPFEKVASLEIVSLQNNEMNGPIPSSIFKLVNITHLDLSSNKLDGIFKFDKLSKLKYLWALSVSNNALLSLTSGSNAYNSLPKLELSSCNISEFPNFVRNLEVLDLFNNNLSRAILECLVLGDIRSNLNVLDLHTNKFHGNIPNSFVANNKLPMLNLNNNDFGGPFPKSLVNCHDLEVLNLGNNKMNDTFPYWLGTLPQLQVLVLRSNYFHGQINPSENESHFSALRILDLSNNEFFGLLPTTYLKSFKGLMTLYNVQRTSMEDLLRIQ
ncbi:PREDICTED: receptor like protein 30 [Theobroma cacao]|uniref:Receptor like protein 30 n=1 Tax=Theobroma cacao TaxID=3641 RepID=A0AB32WL88_THECC|nr:PREDICTED: receptor like protein 30 [Theobroma cacao]